MAYPLKYNTASQEVPLGYFLDSTDGDTEETGLTIANTDIKLHKAGATTLANKNSGGGTHISNGIYYATLDATDTNTYGPLVIFCHVSGALAVRLECVVMNADAYDALYAADGTGHIEADAVQISGDAAAADNLELDYDGTGYNKSNSTIGTCTTNTDMRGTDSAALASTLATKIPQNLNLTASGNIGIDWANVENPTTALDLSGTDIQLVDTCTTNTDMRGTDSAYTGTPPTAEAISDAVWDEIITGAEHNVNTSAAKYLRQASQAIGVTGTAQSGTSTTIVLESGGVTNDDILNGEQVQIIEGTGIGQSRLITDSVASSDTVTVDRAWTVSPDNTSVYSIAGADCDVRAIEGDDAAADNLLAFLDGTGYAGGTTKLDVNIASSDDIDLTATQKTSVNAEVDTALATTTYAEPSSVPAATASLKDKIGWLTALSRNKLTSTATTQTLRNDADSADIASLTHADDGTTFTRPEWS